MNVEQSYIADIKSILAAARTKAYTAINCAMVEAYWLIGKRIVMQEQSGEKRAAYGEEILKTLSIALTQEFGKGFSSANLRNFRQFYLTYLEPSICYTVCSKLTWSHNRLIMRVGDLSARTYYLNEAAAQGWSVRTLDRNINTFYYQRLLTSQQKKKHSPASEKQQVEDFIKDPYIFEFLNIPQPTKSTEKKIETGLIDNLQQFLLELGKGFSFVGRQYRISSETDRSGVL